MNRVSRETNALESRSHLLERLRLQLITASDEKYDGTGQDDDDSEEGEPEDRAVADLAGLKDGLEHVSDDRLSRAVRAAVSQDVDGVEDLKRADRRQQHRNG